MFQNRIVQVPIDEIKIDRSNRQRTELTFDSILDLAVSIATNQWISPILVDQDTNFIIAGERRLTAVKALSGAVNGDYSKFSKPEDARILLAPICTCEVNSWQYWTRIPAQLGRDLTEKDIAIYEFIENAQRKDLNWQDKAKAIYSIHAHGLAEDSSWSNIKTGNLTGLDHSTVAKYLKAWRYMTDNPSSEIKTIINESPTLNSAIQTLTRYTSRRQEEVVSLSKPTKTNIKPELEEHSLATAPGPQAGTAPPSYSNDVEIQPDAHDELNEELLLGDRVLINADFNAWAAQYEGKPFNFLHCDFPYGINFNKGGQTSNIKNKLDCDYDDSASIYWDLLNTLVSHRDKLIAESAHIMFWYSQNFERETEDFFTSHFPDATIQDFKLIWHCSDLDGIVPDPQRYGRRTYETAMLITFGDRHIVTPKSLSVAAPRESKTRHHRSQKPMPVLNHFMGMFVDNASRVLDPTTGSGTSLLAAHQLGANKIVGIEKEKGTYETALTFLNKRSDTISL